MGRTAKKTGLWTGDPTVGYTADATAAQLANLGIAKAPTNAAKRVAADTSYALASFGGSLGASIKKQFGVARATAQQENVVVAAGKERLKAGQQTIGETLSIFKGGAQAQAMAAAAAKARAVQEATGASDSQTAAFAMELAKMKYSAQLQAQTAKKAAAQAQAQADAANGTALQAGLQSFQSQATVTAQSAASFVNAAVKENEGSYEGLSVVDVQKDFLSTGIDPASTEGMYAMNLIQQMVMGKMGLDKAAPLAMDKTIGGVPGYEKYGKPTSDAIVASIQADAVDRFMDHPGDGGNDDGLMPPILQPGQTPQQAGVDTSKYVYDPVLQKYVLKTAPRLASGTPYQGRTSVSTG